MKHKSFKYKLLPTNAQRTWLSHVAGSVRWLWNYMLDLNQQQWKSDKKFVFAFHMNNLLPKLKRAHNWLKVPPSHSLQQKCIDLDTALKSMKKSKFNFPKFKTKSRGKDSFRIPQTNDHIKIVNTHIVIPKIGEIKWKYNRPIEGIMKSITISCHHNNWYVSILCEIPKVEKVAVTSSDKCIGIDLGIKTFAVLSNGQTIVIPEGKKQKDKKSQQKIKHLQHKISRQQATQKREQREKSNNQKKIQLKLQKENAKITNRRNDFLHKESRKLIEKYDVICIETLHIKDMLKKKHGDGKTHLRRNIQEQAWARFGEMLEYKANYYGKHLTKIPEYEPSTKTCSSCGHKKKMPLNQREYWCENISCSVHLEPLDRDYNAALNILNWGLFETPIQIDNTENRAGTAQIHACEDSSLHNQAYDCYEEVSLKQETVIHSSSQIISY